MLDAIATPFGWLMRQLYELTNNFGVAIILFSLIVAIVLLPFMAKSKKGMMRMTRLQPKLMELQRKHEGNQQKLNEEIAKLYRQEKASPMGGCLWSLLPFPILLALYRAVIRPITLVMGVSEELLAEGGALVAQGVHLAVDGGGDRRDAGRRKRHRRPLVGAAVLPLEEAREAAELSLVEHDGAGQHNRQRHRHDPSQIRHASFPPTTRSTPIQPRGQITPNASDA